MKKTILTLVLFAGFSLCTFSQSVKVENGKAISVTPAVPEVKTVLTKEQLMRNKDKLKQEINMTENEISAEQKRLSDFKIRLTECEAVCTKLGYK